VAGRLPLPRLRPRQGWRLADGRFECAGCQVRTSTTAGTIFDRTRTPLTVWFTVCWLFASGKDGISALSLQRTLEIGSYQTVWAMLHRLRSVLVRSGRDRLSGTVEVDETFIGGEEPGLRGGRARGKKVLTGIAVEVREPKGIGRCRMAPLTDASADSLHAFVTDHVEPGSTPGAAPGLRLHRGHLPHRGRTRLHRSPGERDGHWGPARGPRLVGPAPPLPHPDRHRRAESRRPADAATHHPGRLGPGRE